MFDWDGVDRWKAFSYPSAVRSVQVDPDRILLLDVNYTNNSWTRNPRADTAATRWSAAWLTWLEDCLLSWAALA